MRKAPPRRKLHEAAGAGGVVCSTRVARGPAARLRRGPRPMPTPPSPPPSRRPPSRPSPREAPLPPTPPLTAPRSRWLPRRPESGDVPRAVDAASSAAAACGCLLREQGGRAHCCAVRHATRGAPRGRLPSSMSLERCNGPAPSGSRPPPRPRFPSQAARRLSTAPLSAETQAEAATS